MKEKIKPPPKWIKQSQRYFLPILNGLIGDKFGEENPLAIKMSFRQRGCDSSVNDLDLHKRLRGKARHVVIFVHGLMHDEGCWDMEEKKTCGYGALLHRDLGYTTLYIRYNTGLHISQNGRTLAGLLQELIDRHGSQITMLTIIGHSMGGLIARSAGHYAKKQGHTWIKKLSRVILIGTPQYGSHWEQTGHLVSFVLKSIWSIHTRLIGKLIDQRSSGIKDLRWGFMTDEDWQDKNAANLFYNKRVTLEPLENTRFHIIAGSLHRDERSFLNSYFGDGLVSKASALKENLGTVKFFPGTGHLKLLRSQAVYKHIKSVFRKGKLGFNSDVSDFSR